MSKLVIANNNPKGKNTCDCVIRALMMATGMEAKAIINELTNIYLTKGWFLVDAKCYGKFLTDRGYVKNKQARKLDNTKYTAEEFCTYLNNSNIQGAVIAHVGGNHVSTFVNIGTPDNKNYMVHDTWDCTKKCVGNYWTME